MDGSSEVSLAYRRHLAEASTYYTELLHKLEECYGITVAALESSQLEGWSWQARPYQYPTTDCFHGSQLSLVYIPALADILMRNFGFLRFS